MSHLDINIKHLEPIRGLTLRFILQNHLHFARVSAEIRNTAKTHSFRASSYPIHITYATVYDQSNTENEYVLPINDSWTESLPLPTFGTMTVREIPSVVAATYIHTGDPHSINDRLLDVEQWVEANSYVLAGSLRLVYGRAIVERLPMDEWTFEVQYPITTAIV
jgi:effector-binding domain-containing protein